MGSLFLGREKKVRGEICRPGTELLALSFAKKKAASTITITTPFDVWVDIMTCTVDGQSAFMDGRYAVTGDISLLMGMNEKFYPNDGCTEVLSVTGCEKDPLARVPPAWLKLLNKWLTNSD